MSWTRVLQPYRDRSFWGLQIGGWGLYAIEGSLASASFFPHGAVHVAIALFVTSLLHPLYLRALTARVPPAGLAVIAVLGSSAAAVVGWLLDSRLPFGVEHHVSRPLGEVFALALQGILTREAALRYLVWSAAYFTLKHWEVARDERERALEASRLAQSARLELLNRQISPHFLFNALNSIQALIPTDPPRAEAMVEDVSSFLLYTLRQSDDPYVPLREEAQAVASYIAIQSARFEGRLQASVRVDEAAAEALVPPLLVYPLVENAIKYGMQTGPLPVRVSVTASLQGDRLRIEVVNSGRWVPPGAGGTALQGAGIGLQTVRGRLAQLYPDRHRLDVATTGGEVRMAIELTTTGAPCLDVRFS
ncbi:MAG TPA: histidine kinase [Vicinamibacterales bacterium]|nr:histidine kinase [Vicinamibacterales bacterium]